MSEEYALQWRLKGEIIWITPLSRYRTPDEARRVSEHIKIDHKEIETRIVCIPKTEWEVVK